MTTPRRAVSLAFATLTVAAGLATPGPAAADRGIDHRYMYLAYERRGATFDPADPAITGDPSGANHMIPTIGASVLTAAWYFDVDYGSTFAGMCDYVGIGLLSEPDATATDTRTGSTLSAIHRGGLYVPRTRFGVSRPIGPVIAGAGLDLDVMASGLGQPGNYVVGGLMFDAGAELRVVVPHPMVVGTASFTYAATFTDRQSEPVDGHAWRLKLRLVGLPGAPASPMLDLELERRRFHDGGDGDPERGLSSINLMIGVAGSPWDLLR